MGKRKIPIEKIEDEQALAVTFSKRRKGLFNKAMELSIICDAKNAVIVFSPRVGRVFTFCHPSVDELVHHYRNGTRPPTSTASITNAASNDNHIENFKSEAENERVEKHNTEEELFWWEMLDVDSIQSQAELENLYNHLLKEKEQRMNEIAEYNEMSSDSSHVDQNPILASDQNNVVESDEQSWDECKDIIEQFKDDPCDSPGNQDSKEGIKCSSQDPLYLTNEASDSNSVVENNEPIWDNCDDITAFPKDNPLDTLYTNSSSSTTSDECENMVAMFKDNPYDSMDSLCMNWSSSTAMETRVPIMN